VALFDRPVPFQQKFVSMLPRSMATAISQQTYGLGPLRLSDITASQHAIAAIIWSLAQQGAINLPPHLVRARKV
jgi:flagellar motor switch protein FliG